MQRRRHRDNRAKWPRSRYRLGPKPAAEADIAGITEHLRKTVGEIDFVLHERKSELVHVDVNVCLARPGRPFHVLATSGMSALPMRMPPVTCDCCSDRLELALALPKSWPIRGPDASRRQHAWPVKMLIDLARYPHRWNTALGPGHTMASADPERPYIDGTSYGGLLLAPPVFLPLEFVRADTALGAVQFLMPIPLFEVEVEYKLEHGAPALFGRLETFSPSALGPLDVERMPAC